MSVWMLWVIGVLASNVSYNVAMKVTASSTPMWAYMLVGGMAMLGISAIGYARDTQNNLLSFTGSQYLGILALGVALAALEYTMYRMYGSGAPISLARVMTATGSMTLLLLIGVFFFKEQITPQQTSGIVLALLGIVLIVWK